MVDTRNNPLKSRFPLTERSRNLVRFCRHLPEETLDASFAGDFGFRDAGSRFAILKNVKTAPGPDECFGLFARDDRTLFRKVLGLQVAYEGLDPERQANVLTYSSMNYYRSHIVEHFFDNGIQPLPPIEGECVVWFAAADVLGLRYRLRNKSDAPVAVRLTWFSEGEPGLAYAGATGDGGFRFANTQQVIGDAYRAHGELRAHDASVRFACDGTRFASIPVEREIAPRETLDCRFAFRFRFNDEPAPTWPADVWRDSSLERAIADTEQAYAALPEPPARFACQADLALKAAGVLRSLRYRDFDARRRPIMTVHVGKSGTAATWFWDTGVSLPGLALAGERDAANGAIRLLLNGIRDDGTPPMTYELQRYKYGYQIPLVAWGVGHYLALSRGALSAAEVYEPLARYVRHWMTRYVRPERGLAVYPPGGTALDDALRWHTGSPLAGAGQPWYERDWGHSRPDLFYSPDINAFLYLELRTLAELAAALGRADEAADWRGQANRLAEAINAWLIEPVSGLYQDRHIETGVFTDMINLASFIPVYAGIAPREVAVVACRDYLLSPAHFLTTLPFPVIDRAHPTFRSGGWLHEPPSHPGALVQQAYWMGRTWIHGDCWLLGALWQSGFQEEADAIAGHILAAIGKNEAIHECYDSLTGYGNGHPEFLWSSAATLMLIHRFYTRPSVASLAPASVPCPRHTCRGRRAAATPGSVPAAAPGSVPAAAPGSVPAAAPGSVPAAAPGSVPAAAPGSVPAAAPGSVPAAAPGSVPAAAPAAGFSVTTQ